MMLEVSSVKLFIITRNDGSFLEYPRRRGYTVFCNDRFCLVETLDDFFAWCKSIKLPENRKVPRIPISQSLAVLLTEKLMSKYPLAIIVYDTDYGIGACLVDASTIHSWYMDNDKLSRVRAISVFGKNGEKKLHINSVKSTIAVYYTSNEELEEITRNILDSLSMISRTMSL